MRRFCLFSYIPSVYPATLHMFWSCVLLLPPKVAHMSSWEPSLKNMGKLRLQRVYAGRRECEWKTGGISNPLKTNIGWVTMLPIVLVFSVPIHEILYLWACVANDLLSFLLNMISPLCHYPFVFTILVTSEACFFQRGKKKSLFLYEESA